MRSGPSKAILLASVMVSHTKVLPQTNRTTLLRCAALTCTTSTIILAFRTSLNLSFKGLTWSCRGDDISDTEKAFVCCQSDSCSYTYGSFCRLTSKYSMGRKVSGSARSCLMTEMQSRATFSDDTTMALM